MEFRVYQNLPIMSMPFFWTVHLEAREDCFAVFEGDRWTVISIEVVLADLGTCIHLR